MKIYPYKSGSQSAKALAEALGIKRIKHEGNFIHIPDVLINWGASKFKRELAAERILNHPNAVAKASNKLETFITLFGVVPSPLFTTEREEALEWLAEGNIVVERHKLNGHSGEGIRIVEPGEELQEAPLYTKYFPRKEEYRVHVFQDEAFFVQRKARKKEVADEKVNWKIRNHGNGFVFAHKDLQVPDGIEESAIRAVQSLGLDFGAVDIGCKLNGHHVVFEVNTACGLEGTTLEKYVEQFKKWR